MVYIFIHFVFWVNLIMIEEYKLFKLVNKINSKKQERKITIVEPFISRFSVNEKGNIIEQVKFNDEVFELKYNCIRCHIVFGPSLSFNPTIEE